MSCESCSSQSGVATDSSLLEYDGVSLREYAPTFRRVFLKCFTWK